MRSNLLSRLCVLASLATAARPVAGRDPITVEPGTGTIAVETTRYRARFDGGTLVYLHNRLTDRTMIDVGLDPQLPVTLRTALYVTDSLEGDPYWIYPASAGDGRATVTVKDRGRDGFAVTYTGLLADAAGTEQRRFPEAELTVTVAVDRKSGDLLVTTAGRNPGARVIGSAFAYAGLMTRSFDYAVEHSGLRHRFDFTQGDAARRQGVLEWSNLSHDKRTGLGGFLWHAPVTVQAAQEDPRAAFAVWAEDDLPRYKLLVRAGKGNAYVTYSTPPYDENHATESVVWRMNVYNRGWTAAATPFANSLSRRGATANRASWAKDISLIVCLPGLGGGYLDSLMDTFPPECRSRIVLWLPQSWRTLTNTRDAKTHDAYYWDNTFSEETAQAITRATAAGFRVTVYTNPHYNWGSAEQVIDPEVARIVAGFAQYPLLDTISRKPQKYGANNLAYTPYREHMLGTFRHIFDRLDVSLYLDTTHQFMLDGRGRIDGLTSYDGAIALFKGVRKLKREQFLGTEEVNELAVMAGGCDYSLCFDMHWAHNWEKQKAAQTHPIVNYLYRDTTVQVSQRVNPWAYGGVRYYHLSEEMTERLGTIATTEWLWQGTQPVPATPEQRHWFDKIRLYALRGLRPIFPEVWEDNIMSYLQADDGAVFVYEETDYGSRLVERSPKGPIVHSARAWKKNVVRTDDGGIPGWLGRTDDGAWIGLDTDNAGYVIAPRAQPDPRLRIRSLPAGICLRDVSVADAIVTLSVAQLPAPTGAPVPAAATTVRLGLTSARPVARVATPDLARLVVGADGAVDVPLNTPLAFILTDGAIAPFEYGGRFVVPLPAGLGIGGDRREIRHPLGAWDQNWNAPLHGPVNPRPGTLYSVSFDAAAMRDQNAHLACFLTSGGTQSSGFFDESGGVELVRGEPRRVTIAGVRNTGMTWAWDHTLNLRIFSDGGIGQVTNLSPIAFIRPELAISDTTAIDLGTVKPGQGSAPSVERRIANSQTGTVAIGDKVWRTVLYGTARVTAPADKPYLQSIDDVGVVLIGDQAPRFELGDGGQALKLLGADGQSGLAGGETPETEGLTVRFIGSDQPGDYTCTVRIVTQAGNLGTCSTGKPGEPLAGLYYVDVPVAVHVKE